MAVKEVRRSIALLDMVSNDQGVDTGLIRDVLLNQEAYKEFLVHAYESAWEDGVITEAEAEGTESPSKRRSASPMKKRLTSTSRPPSNQQPQMAKSPMRKPSPLKPQPRQPRCPKKKRPKQSAKNSERTILDHVQPVIALKGDRSWQVVGPWLYAAPPSMWRQDSRPSAHHQRTTVRQQSRSASKAPFGRDIMTVKAIGFNEQDIQQIQVAIAQ